MSMRPRITRVALIAAVSVSGLLSGCGSDTTPPTGPIPAGGITLTTASPVTTVTQGGTATIVLAIARTGSVGPASLVVSGAPAGVATAILPTPTTLDSTTLSLQVGAAVPVGTYPLRITVTAAGAATSSLTITLAVTSPGVGSGNLTLAFCGLAESVPIWLAVQNAAGTWQRVLPNTNNTFRISRVANEGVAYVAEGPSGFSLTIRYDALSELLGGCIDPTTFRTVSGTVRGLGANDNARILLGPLGFAFPTAASPEFRLFDVPPGTVDLLATREQQDTATDRSIVNRAIIRRGLTLSNLGILAPVDFSSSAESFALEPLTVTSSGAGSDSIETSVSFRTANGTIIPLSTSSPTRPAPLQRIPAGRTAAGDLHSIQVTADAANSFRTVLTERRDPSSTISLALGPALSTPTFDVTASSPYVRFRVRLARQAEYRDFLTVVWQQSGNNVAVSFSDRGPGADAVLDWTLPDFTGVAGWDNRWAPTANSPFINTGALASQFVRGDGTVGRLAGWVRPTLSQ